MLGAGLRPRPEHDRRSPDARGARSYAASAVVRSSSSALPGIAIEVQDHLTEPEPVAFVQDLRTVNLYKSSVSAFQVVKSQPVFGRSNRSVPLAHVVVQERDVHGLVVRSPATDQNFAQDREPGPVGPVGAEEDELALGSQVLGKTRP